MLLGINLNFLVISSFFDDLYGRFLRFLYWRLQLQKLLLDWLFWLCIIVARYYFVSFI